jgi:hypothetical protein
VIKQLKKALGLIAVLGVISVPVQAELIDQYVNDSSYTWSGSYNASLGIDIQDNGENQVIRMSANSYSEENGYNYWYGEIPSDAVLNMSIHGLSVNVDTCQLTAMYSWGTAPCGVVAVDITSEPGWENFRTWTQPTHYHTWYGYLQTRVSHSHTRFTSTTGTVNGVSIDIDNSVAPHTWNSVMGSSSGMSVSVSTH